MRKQIRKILSLWLLMFFAVTVNAADWPSTLYMEQTTFSSTGRKQATETANGVYEFKDVDPYTLSTTAPRYYIFSSATSSSAAKKGTETVLGAATIADGTNVQPEEGVAYPLVDLSSKEDATALYSNPICSFLPLYYANSKMNITVDLNTMTVVFRYDKKAEDAETLRIFDKSVTLPIASTPVDADGKARFSLRLPTERIVYFSANGDTRANSQYECIWGSSNQLNPQNVTIAKGNSYPFVRTTYYEVYSVPTCSFTIPAGEYDIVADIKNGTIEFSEYTGAYRAKPEKIYIRKNNFSTLVATSTGENGVYTFTYDKTGSTTGTPDMLVFTDATSYTNVGTAAWTLGATKEDFNVTPEYGKTYPLVDINPDKAYYNELCTFMPIYPQKYNIVVDLNNMTVVFNPTVELDPVTSLKVVNNSLASIAEPVVNADGKLCYSVRGAADTKIFFSTGSSATTIKTTGALNFGAGGHATPVNQKIEYGQSYKAEPTTYRRVYNDDTSFFVLPGACDIVFDPETHEFTVNPYTGAYRAKPETLYIRYNTFSSTAQATANGENGIYTFQLDKSANYTTDPFCLVFTDATSYKSSKTASWVLGSTKEETNIAPEYGKTYPLVDIDPETTYEKKVGTFMPLYPQAYNITVDLNNMTVVFNPTEELDPLTQMYIVNESFKPVGKSVTNADGKLCFSFRGAADTKVFFSTGDSSTAIKTTGARNFGAGGHATPVNQQTEYDKSYTTAPITYRRLQENPAVGYFVLPGKCDIVFDPEVGEFTISPYTGAYDVYPDILYIKASSFSYTYGSAEGNDGVYVFEYKTQNYNYAPRNIIFTDASTSSQISPISWVLGASEDGSVAEPYPGMETPLFDVNADDVRYNNKSYFSPFYPHTYTITVDMKNRTAKWGEPVENPTTLNLEDIYFDNYAKANGDKDGIFTFNTTTYSSHPLLISESTTLSGLQNTSWTFMGSPLTNSKNVDITDGLQGPAYRTTYYHVQYDSKGFWMTPEGCNRLTARLDTKNNTIEWNVTPVEPREIEVLYLLNSDLESIAEVVSDNSGIFDFTVNVSSGSVAFSDSKTSKNDPGRIFYGSCVPYGGRRITPVDGTEYTLYMTSPKAIEETISAFYLKKGKWHIVADMNTGKVVFEDISRGGNWYIPESIALCDDDLKTIVTAPAAEEGVFTFSNVKIESEKDLVKVVFVDTAEGGSIFGANATGDLGPTVVSGETYELYMPSKTWVTTDGASCFGLVPSTYNITVDFVNKTVLFVDPTIPIYPDKIQLTESGETPSTLATASGDGVYTFSLNLKEAKNVYFTEPTEGKLYGAKAAATAADGATVTIEESETPVAITIPEGIWTVEFSLADMTATFSQTPRLVFKSTTMPEGTPFYSYFGAGTTPSADFVFSNDLSSINNVYVVLGDYKGGVPTEGATTALGLRRASLSDNMLHVDFTGLTYAIPEGAEKKVHIVLIKVTDRNGNLLECEPVSGLAAGSMVFEYPFSEFERMTIDAKYDLEQDANIDEVKTISMKVNHFDHITFSNVMFAEDKPLEPSVSTDGTEEAPAQQFAAHWTQGETDADGYTEMLVNVPMAARGLGKLRLYLENLDIDDNYEGHEYDINGKFVSNVDPTMVIVTTPAEDEKVERIDEIMLTWNHPVISSVGNMAQVAHLVNKDTNESVEATYSYPSAANSLLLTPVTPIENSGVYTLELEKGDLVFNDDPDATNKPTALSFAVDDSLSIGSLTISESDTVEVIDLSGIMVRRGKGRATLEGLSGIYIVNGVKCLLTNGSPNVNIRK